MPSHLPYMLASSPLEGSWRILFFFLYFSTSHLSWKHSNHVFIWTVSPNHSCQVGNDSVLPNLIDSLSSPCSTSQHIDTLNRFFQTFSTACPGHWTHLNFFLLPGSSFIELSSPWPLNIRIQLWKVYIYMYLSLKRLQLSGSGGAGLPLRLLGQVGQGSKGSLGYFSSLNSCLLTVGWKGWQN